MSERWDCVVVGAGVAGLAAARTLAEAGLRVVLLEARERVGGRLLTEHVPGEQAPVELGAEFVHGRPPELLALLAEAGLATYETAGTDMRFVDGGLRATGEEDGAAFALLDELREDEPDRSFDAFLEERGAGGGVGAGGGQADARRARQYVEGFNAADAGRIGTVGLARQQLAEEAIEGDRAARVVEGYGALAAYMLARAEAAGVVVRLGVAVREVRWSEGEVRVVVGSEGMRASELLPGSELVAARSVVTVPVGVLQGGAMRFVPEPEEVMRAVRSLAAGPVMRIVLRFRTRFWAEGMRFLFTEGELPPTWWTSAPRESHLLVGWVGGPRALALGSQGEWVTSGLRSLERIFGLAPGALDEEVLGAWSHDWQADRWSRGAYSYVPVDAGGAAAVLARPVAGTLFFAGEHTDVTGHPGTVHGALRSGLRVAGQVLRVVGG